MHCTSERYNDSEAVFKLLTYSDQQRCCFSEIPDAPRPHWSKAKCLQMLQDHVQVLLKAAAVMELNSRFDNIGLIEKGTFGAAATSMQVCGRP